MLADIMAKADFDGVEMKDRSERTWDRSSETSYSETQYTESKHTDSGQSNLQYRVLSLYLDSYTYTGATETADKTESML